MSANQRSVELLVKAKLQGLREFDTVAKSISEVTKLVDKQAQSVDRSSASYAKLRAAKNSLADLGGEVQAIGSLISSYKKVAEAVDTSTNKLTEQQGRLDKLTAAISANGKATESQATQQTRLQGAIERTRATIASGKALLNEYDLALKETGIDSKNLAVAQDKVKGAIAAVGKAASQTKVQIDKVNLSQANGFKLQRTSLDLYQRVRGQILSVTAAYVGLYGAIDFVKSSTEALGTKQSVLNQLAIGGDAKSAAEDYKYIADQANRLGINLEVAAKGYAKLNSSVILGGGTKQQSRFVFESFSEISKVFNLATEAQDRGIYAISQIFSKGKVMAEEFNGQLGDLLPGLQGVAKEALKVKFPDFQKAMKDGKVGVDDFITIMAKYRESIQGQLPAATDNFQAKVERLNNTLFNFKVGVAEGGVAEEFGKLLDDLNKFFQSNEGVEFGKNLADVFRIAAKALRFLVDHFQELATLLVAGVVYKAIKGIILELLGLYNGIVEWTPKVLEFFTMISARFASLPAAARGGVAGVMVALSALTGWSIGEWADKNFVIVRQFGISLALGFAELAVKTKSLWLDVTDSLKIYFNSLIANFTRGIQTFLKMIPGMSAQAEKFGMVADAFDKRASDKSKEKGRRHQLEGEELARLRAVGLQQFMDASKPSGATTTTKKAPVGTTAQPDPSGKPTGGAGLTEEELEKRRNKMAQLISDIDGQLNSLENQVQKKTADTLQEKLDAIEADYTNLKNKIGKVSDPKVRTEMTARLDKATKAVQLEVIEDFNNKLVEERRKLDNDLEQAEADAGRRELTSLEARLKAVEAQYKEKFDEIAKYRKMLQDGGQATGDADFREKKLQSAVDEAKAIATKKFYLDDIARQEKLVNDLIDQRTARLKVVNIERQAGVITESQALEKTAAIVAEMQPQIDAAADAAIQFAEANMAAFGAENQVAILEYIAKLKEAKASGDGLRTSLVSVRELQEGFAGAAMAGIDALAKGLGNAVMKAGSLKDAFRNAWQAFMGFAADFLRQIALMIIKQQILNTLQSSGGGSKGFFGRIVGAISSMYNKPAAAASTVKHEGGMAGSVGGRSRAINPAAFIGAPRYHSGGIVGLQANEVPAILQKNEEVLTRNDPRHAMNGGGKSAAPAAQPQNIKIMNMIDSGSVISEGLSSQEGTKAIINFMRANRTQLKSVLG